MYLHDVEFKIALSKTFLIFVYLNTTLFSAYFFTSTLFGVSIHYFILYFF